MTILNTVIVALTQQSLPFVPFTGQWPPDLGKFSAVWILGGDGTLNYFINRYPDTTIPIALFKGGSGNDFAWKLYGDQSTAAYLELAIVGKHRKVDAGICNGKYFLNGVGIGFDGEVVKAMGSKKFLSAGHLAYLLVVFQKIFSFREKGMRIRTDGLERFENIFLLSIANGSRYGGGFLVAPLAIINDGELDLVIIKKIPVLSRLFYLPKVQQGRHLDLPFVEWSRERYIRIDSKVQLQAHLDGEWMGANYFDIHVLPQKFSFIY